MIYLDTSVVLAQLLREDRSPPDSIWQETLVSSRLLEYESWVRLNALGAEASHGEDLREVLGRLAFLELEPRILRRALEPFPAPVRTLDALHLASAEFIRAQGQKVLFASYDARQIQAAKKMRIPLYRV